MKQSSLYLLLLVFYTWAVCFSILLPAMPIIIVIFLWFAIPYHIKTMNTEERRVNAQGTDGIGLWLNVFYIISFFSSIFPIFIVLRASDVAFTTFNCKNLWFKENDSE